LQAPLLTTSISASPASIEVGEDTSITVVLRNGGDAPATGAGMTISVPNPLEVGGASPDPDQVDSDPGGVSINYEFGTLGPGESRSATITATGDRDPGSPVITEVAGRADGLTSFSDVSITVTEPEASAVRISAQGPTFAQVGEQVGYSLKIANPRNAPVTDLAIVYLVPSEIDVERAGLSPGVDAVQIGAFKGKEDIVWAIDKLGPKKKLTVEWLGKVTKGGDLAAQATVRAESEGVALDRASASTYLANEIGTSVDNPDFEPIVRRVVTTETVTVTPSERAPTSALGTTSGSDSSELPFTGGTPGKIIAIAIGMMVGGGMLVALTSRRLRGRRVIVASIALLILATACIGSEEPPPDRVKGETITRGDGENGGGQNGDNSDQNGNDDAQLDQPSVQPGNDGSPDNGPDGTDPGDLAGPAGIANVGAGTSTTGPVPLAPETRTVRRVQKRTIDEDDLAVEAAPSFSGRATTVSMNGGRGSSASNGVARLTSSVDARGQRLVATVTLSNRSNKRKLHMSGDLLYRVGGFRMLRSQSIDHSLNPDGEVSATFEFRLPGGSTTTQPSFSAS
jgi:hypothetical protein